MTNTEWELRLGRNYLRILTVFAVVVLLTVIHAYAPKTTQKVEAGVDGGTPAQDEGR